MTTEKDAMALAVLQTIADYESTFARAPILEARAHLASRIAELEAQLEASIAMTGENLRRAARAEAELAAVRNVLTSIRDSTFRSALILRGMAQRGLDAARGEGG